MDFNIETLINQFNTDLYKHKTYDREYFLKGIYKQLVVTRNKKKQSEGRYKRLLSEMNKTDEKRFLNHFYDTLVEYDLVNHAKRLAIQRIPEISAKLILNKRIISLNQ